MKKAAFDHKAYKSLIKCCFFFLLILGSTQTFAQQARGKVEVIKDPLVDTLIAKRFTLNKVTEGVLPITFSAYGYRVQFFSGSNRKDAYNAQARMQNEHPELRTYILYSEPNFKVRAGDFRSRLEAEKLIQDIRNKFPSLFIISEKINPPKTDADND